MDELELIVLMHKDGHDYAFTCPENEAPALILHLARVAQDPGLNFDWKDAAIMSQKVRELMDEKATRTQ